MKNFAKVLTFAAIAALVVVPAFAATKGGADNTALCTLIGKMQGIFKTLRILAFVGAGFYMAEWAWGWISSGKVELKDIKGKGVGLLVGFTLLFIIGFVLSFLISAAGEGGSLGCKELTTGWGK